jgi:type I restriction enzyme, S subunit
MTKYPKDWVVTSLEAIGAIKSGGTPLRSEGAKYFSVDGIPWVKTMDLNNGHIEKTGEKITKLAIKESACSIFPKDTVLVAMYGGFNQIGRTGILTMESAINQAISAIILRSEVATPEYVIYWLNANVLKWRQFAASSRKDPNITRKDVCEFPIVLPPLLEQCRIAEVLGVWDESIDLLERLIGKTRSRKQGLMQQLLTGKKRFKEFEGSEWKEYQLSQIANITMGTSPKSASYNSKKEGLPLLQGNADIKNRVSLPRIWTTDVTKECHPTDILISVRAPVGTVAISLHHACIGRGIASVKAKSKILPNYLYQLLLFSEPKWASLSQGSTFDSVNSADIKNRVFSIPLMIPEQEKVAAVLSAADEEISTLEKQLAAYKQQKLGLMQQLLTGSIRI